MKDRDLDLVLRAFDDELSEGDRLQLERLLATSPAARAEQARLAALRRLVAGQKADAFGPFFADRVMRRLPRTPAPARSTPALAMLLRSWHRVGLAAVAVFLVMGVGLSLWLQPTTVTVPYGAQATVDLPDGSTVELGGGSSLRYRPFLGRSERRVELKGEAFFSVEKGRRPFIVVTFNAAITVKGTTFNVRAWPDDPVRETAVALASGRVEVTARARPDDPVVLAPGEATTVAADTTAPRRPAPVVLERALAWRSGGLAFVDQPLSSVFATLERRYGLQIRLAPGVDDTRYTYLNPRPASAGAVLADICTALDLRYRRTADGFEVLALQDADARPE